MRELIAAYRARDPAASGELEIRLLYPGIRALRAHRKAHWLWRHGFKFLARWLSDRTRRRTGIEIHPGATIGRRLVIDHGMGVVIGETAEVGDDVLIYQGVTLGGTGKDTGKRHPTIGSNVLIGSGAKVLGPITVGDNSRIAAGAVVLRDIPPCATAVGVPARIARIDGRKINYAAQVDQIHITDPVAQELLNLSAQMEEIKDLLTRLEH
ncbi:MAG: serine O-acetyltransferase EpsC [bacterium]